MGSQNKNHGPSNRNKKNKWAIHLNFMRHQSNPRFWCDLEICSTKGTFRSWRRNPPTKSFRVLDGEPFACCSLAVSFDDTEYASVDEHDGKSHILGSSPSIHVRKDLERVFIDEYLSREMFVEVRTFMAPCSPASLVQADGGRKARAPHIIRQMSRTAVEIAERVLCCS